MSDFFKKFIHIFKIKDLRYKILIVLGLLVVFRFAANIPMPDVDRGQLQAFFAQSQLLGFFNIFSGNALSQFSVAMLGVAPYITATIVMQLLTLIFPGIKEMYYEGGETGRAKFNQISRILTVPLAALQAFGFLMFLKSQNVLVFANSFHILRDVIIAITGSMFLMWLGELITEQKIGNGVSLLIFSGIVAGFPSILGRARLSYAPTDLPLYLAMVIVAVLVILGVVIINEAERRIPISYAKRVRGTKIYGGSTTYLPLKINQAGVIPIIFALSILLFPGILGSFIQATGLESLKGVANFFTAIFNNLTIRSLLYFALTFIFTYFYTAITFEPHEIAKNLQKNGAFVPGIRPGNETGSYLSRVVNRTTLAGATFLGLIAVLPFIIQGATNLQFLAIGGTSILIVVAVALETIKQLNTQLQIREYEEF